MGADDRRVRDAGANYEEQEENPISDSVAIQTDHTGWIRVGTGWVDATRIVSLVQSGSGTKVVVEVGDDFVYYQDEASPDEIMERIVYATTDEEEDDDEK